MDYDCGVGMGDDPYVENLGLVVLNLIFNTFLLWEIWDKQGKGYTRNDDILEYSTSYHIEMRSDHKKVLSILTYTRTCTSTV